MILIISSKVSQQLRLRSGVPSSHIPVKTLEFSRFERLEYNVNRSKENKIVGNQANQIEKTNTCTD